MMKPPAAPTPKKPARSIALKKPPARRPRWLGSGVLTVKPGVDLTKPTLPPGVAL